MIEVKNITKNFVNTEGRVEALKNVSLQINNGEIYGIIGLSGAGKSTLVRCINRLEEVSSGEIIISGKNITEINEMELLKMRKKIGMIFQHFNLFNSRTVAGNISYPLEINHVPKAERDKRIEKLLELVGLSDKAAFYPSQLSGGQKQRIGIARALANEPDLLLCDEATSALDPKTTRSILDLIKKINIEMGLTVIVITHQIEVVRQMCTKVAVIEGGTIIEQGLVSEVFDNPKHQTTREFLQIIENEVGSL